MSGMRIKKGMTVVISALALTGGSVALAATGGTERFDASRQVKELAGSGEVALIPSHNAGVGGWCLARLSGGEGKEASEDSDCDANERSVTEGPFQGPIVAESGERIAVLKDDGLWVKTVVALVTAPVVAVSFKGYKPIATHADALLPNHLRGAIIKLRSRSYKPPSLPHFPSGHLIAWGRNGRPISQKFTQGHSLTFGMPVRSWSNGAPARRGVCNIGASGLTGLKLQSGAVASEVRPHADELGKEFVNCAHSYYLLHGKWPLEAYVLLDAAHPGATPASLPGMVPLQSYRGVFVGPGASDMELARRIPGAWVLVSEGKDLQQRLSLLEHLHVMLHIS